MLLVSALALGGAYYRVRDVFYEMQDYHLQQVALLLMQQGDLADQRAEILEPGEDDLDFIGQIWSENGKLMYSSHADYAIPQSTRSGLNTVNWDEELFRIFVLSNNGRTVQVAQSLDVREDALHGITLRLIAPLALLVPLLGLATWLTVGRGLRPLKALRDEVMQRNPASLTPIALEHAPDEVRPLDPQVTHQPAKVGGLLAANPDDPRTAGLAMQLAGALVRLDPKTGAVKEYKIAENKPGYPTGGLGLRADRDGNMWLGNMYQATIVKFDPKTEKFTYWTLPKEANIDAAQLNMVRPESSHIDGKVWSQNNGFAGVHRLDLASGKIETWEPFKGAKEPHNIYDIIPDSKNNVYFTDFRHQHIGRLDAKTGEVKLFEAPVRGSAPRRGMMDPKDRLWFGMYRGDRIGMFDTNTAQFKVWQLKTRWASPYDVVLDKNEEAWTGSMLTDQVTRLNTKTDEMVDYLLPRTTNIRRVFVDNTTTPVTFWVGSNHGASVIKLEPLD